MNVFTISVDDVVYNFITTKVTSDVIVEEYCSTADHRSFKFTNMDVDAARKLWSKLKENEDAEVNIS